VLAVLLPRHDTLAPWNTRGLALMKMKIKRMMAGVAAPSRRADVAFSSGSTGRLKKAAPGTSLTVATMAIAHGMGATGTPAMRLQARALEG
jgi:hypothetical protein